MKKNISFEPSPEVCSRRMDVEITDGLISAVRIVGGCPGNSLGLSKLLIGMTPEKAIDALQGVRCGVKATSCPDQLAKGLLKSLAD